MTNTEFKILANYGSGPGATVEKDGVTFGYYATGDERPVLLLYKKGTEEIAVEIPFPDQKNGNFYGMKVKLQPSQYEYNFREGDQVILRKWLCTICMCVALPCRRIPVSAKKEPLPD